MSIAEHTTTNCTVTDDLRGLRAEVQGQMRQIASFQCDVLDDEGNEANAARAQECIDACRNLIDPSSAVELALSKAAAFDRIFAALYGGEDGQLDADREWDAETLDLVAEIVTEVRNPFVEA